MSEGACLFLGKQMGKHILISWYKCPTATIMTLARPVESDADSCYSTHIILNLTISTNASCLNDAKTRIIFWRL